MATADPSPQRIGVLSRSAWSPSRAYGARLPPKPAVLVAIALAGVGAAATTVALGLANDELDHVAIRAFLNDWITLNFILAGLVAWWRRPDSRFGPLIVAAGFANFLTTFSWANADVPFTIGSSVEHAAAAALPARVPGLSERTAGRTSSNWASSPAPT